MIHLPPRQLRGSCHDRQDELQGLVYRARHPLQQRVAGRESLRGLVDWQIAEGTNGLVPVGTTGESPTLSHEEHGQIVEWCIEQAKGRVPVIAGAGSNSTKEAIALAQHAQESGADAVLVVTPYYNKPTKRDLPALQGDQRRHRHSDHHLQYPGALGDRHVGRHDEAPVRARQHCRREGRNRQRRARLPAAGRDGRDSTSSPARMRRRWVAWPMAAMVASR